MFSAGAGVFFPEPEFFLPEPEHSTIRTVNLQHFTKTEIVKSKSEKPIPTKQNYRG